MAGGIFISYRRDDAAHVAGRMADALAARVGRERVFVDVDSVAPGEDFVRKIETTIKESELFLAVIGANWLSAKAPNGQRRVDLEGDFIRLEVKTALALGMKIVPVLVDGASMPRAEDLPEEMRQLVRHNAVFINHATFARDIGALLDQLAPAEKPKATRGMNMLVLPLGAGVLLLAMLAFALWPKGGAPVGLSSSIALADEPAEQQPERPLVTQAVFKTERSTDGRLSIRAQLAYRDRMREEKRIDGIAFYQVSPLVPEMPQLTVQVTNTTAAAVTISELQFEVVKAEPEVSPLPVLRENQVDYQQVRLFNDGWGPLDAPRLTVKAWGLPEEDRNLAEKSWRGAVSWEPCAQPKDLLDVTPIGVGGRTEDAQVVFDLTGRIPAKFGKAKFICAVGELSYADRGKTETLAVRTRVSNKLPDAVVASPVRAKYDLYLDPDREGYTAIVPAHREIPAGETVAVTIRVITDKSSDFQLRHSVRTSTGLTIPGEAFDLGIFVSPNRRITYLLNEERFAFVPPEEIAKRDKDGLIFSLAFDPQGRSRAQLLLLRPLEPDACEAFTREVALPLLRQAKAPATPIETGASPGEAICEIDPS